jgi:hypothetical protein
MHSIQIKNQAIKFRKNGKSIYDIAKTLNIQTSTVSGWCKDILLTQELRNKIDQNGKLKARSAMLVYTEKLREQRLERTRSNKESGAKTIGKLSDRDILMVGLGLYWGEGYKYENSELGFTNSNLNIIEFYIKWLGLFKITKEDLILRLTY